MGPLSSMSLAAMSASTRLVGLRPSQVFVIARSAALSSAVLETTPLSDDATQPRRATLTESQGKEMIRGLS